MKVGVIGATGYVGGRLVALLAADGHELRLASRDPRGLKERFPDADVVRVDLLDRETLLAGLSTTGRESAVLESMDRDPPVVGPSAPLDDALQRLGGNPERRDEDHHDRGPDRIRAFQPPLHHRADRSWHRHTRLPEHPAQHSPPDSRRHPGGRPSHQVPRSERDATTIPRRGPQEKGRPFGGTACPRSSDRKTDPTSCP